MFEEENKELVMIENTYTLPGFKGWPSLISIESQKKGIALNFNGALVRFEIKNRKEIETEIIAKAEEADSKNIFKFREILWTGLLKGFWLLRSF